MKTYDLSTLTEVGQSGWTMDYYLSLEEMNTLGHDSVLVCDGWPSDQALYDALTALVATWQRTETEDGGVITYTKGER